MKQDRPINILYAEDYPSQRDLVEELLSAKDPRFNVETVENGEEGIEKVKEGGIDAVLSDYEMPKMHGIQFLEQVREHDPKMPFHLYTGKGTEEVAEEATSLDVTDYWRKDNLHDDISLISEAIVSDVESRYSAEINEVMLENVPGIISAISKDGQIVKTRGETERVLGYEGGYREVETLMDHIHPEDRQVINESIEELLSPEGSNRRSVSIRYKDSDGDYIPLEVTGNYRPSMNFDGFVIHAELAAE